MKFRIELSDKAFNRLEFLEDEVTNLSWGYNRIGGCGSFSFSLPREYCNERFISGDFNVKIHRRNPSTGDYDLWYQGYVEAKVPSIKGGSEVIEVRGSGYQGQLSRIYIDDETYAGMDIADIVDDILTNYVLPEMDITIGTIDPTGFSPSTLTFNTDVLSALQTLADITGTREWGVDRNREFNFLQRSTTEGFIYPIGSEKILNFSSDDSFKDIINRVVIQGGDVAGTPYKNTYDLVASQLKYNVRTEVKQNASITTNDVAEQFANAIFEDHSGVVRRGQVELLEEKLIEETLPIGLFRMQAPAFRYGQKAYLTGLYSGPINYQINQISYSVDSNGNLKISMDLGQLRPTLSEALAQIEYELEQLRSGAF